MFSWEKFIDEAEIFPYAASRISYLRYNGICLYPYGYGTSIVGAYMESLETPSNKELARFFEAHGSTIISIFQAIEFGMDD